MSVLRKTEKRRRAWIAGVAAAAGILLSLHIYAGEGGSEQGASFFPASGSAGKALLKEESVYEPYVEKVHVTIPEAERDYTFLWISDLHLCGAEGDPDVTKEHQEEAAERYEQMKSPSGLSGEEIWKLLSRQVDDYGADYVILGADMLDYVTRQNLEKLKEGLDQIQTPWMYLRADHDYGRWFTDMGIKRMRKLHRAVAPQNGLWCVRCEGFTLAGLDNTTSAVSDETLQELQAVCEEGNPVLLFTHVPFDTGQADAPSLAQLSEDGWDGRVLCWGDDDAYKIGEGNMSKVMELIRSPGSVIRAVFAGHLHQTWDGWLTDTCAGHVFSAAYQDHIGLITVSG